MKNLPYTSIRISLRVTEYLSAIELFKNSWFLRDEKPRSETPRFPFNRKIRKPSRGPSHVLIGSFRDNVSGKLRRRRKIVGSEGLFSSKELSSLRDTALR